MPTNKTEQTESGTQGHVASTDELAGSRPKRWTVDRLARAATRLMTTFERRTEVAEDVIDAVEVLRAQRDMLELHYLTPEAAHEASQGAYMQAAHLEWQANNHPDPHRRADLIRRARTALAAGDKLRGL